MSNMAPTEFGGHALPMPVPSPLVGEGSTAIRPELGWVRGTFSGIPMLSEPLTRRRFATPPSPTRGEGKEMSPHPDGFAIRPLPTRGERLAPTEIQ